MLSGARTSGQTIPYRRLLYKKQTYPRHAFQAPAILQVVFSFMLPYPSSLFISVLLLSQRTVSVLPLKEISFKES